MQEVSRSVSAQGGASPLPSPAVGLPHVTTTIPASHDHGAALDWRIRPIDGLFIALNRSEDSSLHTT